MKLKEAMDFLEDESPSVLEAILKNTTRKYADLGYSFLKELLERYNSECQAALKRCENNQALFNFYASRAESLSQQGLTDNIRKQYYSDLVDWALFFNESAEADLKYAQKKRNLYESVLVIFEKWSTLISDDGGKVKIKLNTNSKKAPVVILK